MSLTLMLGVAALLVLATVWAGIVRLRRIRARAVRRSEEVLAQLRAAGASSTEDLRPREAETLFAETGFDDRLGAAPRAFEVAEFEDGVDIEALLADEREQVAQRSRETLAQITQIDLPTEPFSEVEPTAPESPASDGVAPAGPATYLPPSTTDVAGVASAPAGHAEAVSAVFSAASYEFVLAPVPIPKAETAPVTSVARAPALEPKSEPEPKREPAPAPTPAAASVAAAWSVPLLDSIPAPVPAPAAALTAGLVPPPSAARPRVANAPLANVLPDAGPDNKPLNGESLTDTPVRSFVGGGDLVRYAGDSPPLREVALAWFEARGYRGAPASPAVRPIELVLRHRQDATRGYAFVVESQPVSARRVEQLQALALSVGLKRLLLVAEAGAPERASRERRGVRLMDRDALAAELDRLDLRIAAKIIAVARKRSRSVRV